jgi:hypothetical protein
MAGDPQSESHSIGSATFSAWLAQSLRRTWANERSRRRLVVITVVVVAVLAIAVVASLFASLAGESQAYRDGYSAGGTAYTHYSDSTITPEEACRDEASEPGVRPHHDDPTQWVKGCVDAFDLARSDN